MEPSDHSPNLLPALPGGYGFFRALVRMWFSLAGRKIRLLQCNELSEPGAALLVVKHRPDFLIALILVAALERPVRCLLEAKLTFWSSRLARWLGMISYEPDGHGLKTAIQAAGEALSNYEAVALFAAPRRAVSDELASASMTPATLAIDAELRQSGPTGTHHSSPPYFLARREDTVR